MSVVEGGGYQKRRAVEEGWRWRWGGRQPPSAAAASHSQQHLHTLSIKQTNHQYVPY